MALLSASARLRSDGCGDAEGILIDEPDCHPARRGGERLADETGELVRR